MVEIKTEACVLSDGLPLRCLQLVAQKPARKVSLDVNARADAGRSRNQGHVKRSKYASTTLSNLKCMP
jgi:hypothetical protein